VNVQVQVTDAVGVTATTTSAITVAATSSGGASGGGTNSSSSGGGGAANPFWLLALLAAGLLLGPRTLRTRRKRPGRHRNVQATAAIQRSV
jgi:hypothetical protein